MKKYAILLCKSELERMLQTLEVTGRQVFYTHCQKIKGSNQMDAETVDFEVFQKNGLSRDQWFDTSRGELK